MNKFSQISKTQVSVMLLGTIFPNSGNYGAPVAMFAFGATGFQYAVIFMVIHAFLMNTVGIFIASIIILNLEIVMMTYEKIS
jgi:malate permease and related proteins